MKAITAPTYAADGVSLDVGDNFSGFAARTCRLQKLSPECEFSLEPDGNGTKPVITTAAIAHAYSGHDLFAMTGMDSVRYGGKPLVLVNQLDVSSLGESGSKPFLLFCEMINGLRRVAKQQDVVLLKGETAEMGVCVASENPSAITNATGAA